MLNPVFSTYLPNTFISVSNRESDYGSLKKQGFSCSFNKNSRVRKLLILFQQLSDVSVDDVFEILLALPKCISCQSHQMAMVSNNISAFKAKKKGRVMTVNCFSLGKAQPPKTSQLILYFIWLTRLYHTATTSSKGRWSIQYLCR